MILCVKVRYNRYIGCTTPENLINLFEVTNTNLDAETPSAIVCRRKRLYLQSRPRVVDISDVVGERQHSVQHNLCEELLQPDNVVIRFTQEEGDVTQEEGGP